MRLKEVLKRVLPLSVRVALRGAAFEPGYHLWRYTRGRGQRVERPIFMLGCPRSGTTIAAELFALHPDVANLSEAADVWDPRHYRDLEADHYWTAAQVTRGDAARLHARFEYVRRYLGKERFFNKYPRNSVRIEYIRAVFPDAVFLHVIRDGRAVVASVLEFIRARPRLQNAAMALCHPPDWRELLREDRAEQCALQWRAVVSYVLSKKAELGPAYHEFRYEELCDDPRGVLAAAWRFAGLRVEEETLAKVPERLDSQNYKWKETLSSRQIEQVARIQGPLLAQMGYPL